MDKKNKKIKGLTLTSGIITLLFGIGMLAVAILGVYLMIAAYTTSQTGNAAQAFAFVFTAWLIIPIFLLVGAIGLGVGISNFVLGIFLITSSTKDDREYLKRKAFVITTIVFDFIIMSICFIVAIASSKDEQVALLVGAIVGAFALFSAIIKIVDLKQTKKRYAPIEEAEEKEKANVNFGALQNDSSKLESELKKLDEMKANGTISEEEYKNLRQNAIEKSTK